RIDPFTNGMPSLHIGIPFAVWLCLVKWDEDNRWRNYTNFLAAYITLTGFTVVYLGIHWFSDIIGGMLIAFFAVQISESSQGLWKMLDERTFNARLVTVLTSRDRTTSWAISRTKRAFQAIKSPTSRETGLAITMVLVLTASVIVWDITHRDLPASGVESPVEATAADGWLVSLDNSSVGWKVVVIDLSNPRQEIELEHQELDRNSTFDTGWDMLAIANNSTANVYNLAESEAEPWVLNVSYPSEIHLAEWLGHGIVLLVVEDGELRGITLDGAAVVVPEAPTPSATITTMAVHDNRLAMVYDDQPAKVRLGRVGLDSISDQPLSFNATEEENTLLESWGQVVDEVNATIVQLDLDYDWLVAAVNVTAVDRLVIVDLERGESWLISDAKFPAHDPAVGHGIVVWASQWNLNPSDPKEDY
nr:phosphatase PAP2 family protein [Candidatus Poseidoniales archaeon]